MRIATVIGNRPQFVKAAAVSGPLRTSHEEVLIHTGQHYDDELSDVFFRELGLPAPDRELGLGVGGRAGDNAGQTARMLGTLAPLLSELHPDAVIVYGDTNSTLAGGLAAAQTGLPVAHVEAGMRSFDRSMPEELNRVLTDHLSGLLLCASQTAVDNLRREGMDGAIELVGDVMVDVARLVAPAAARRRDVLEQYGVTPGSYLLVTAHRSGNVDDPSRLACLVELLLSLPGPVLLPLHPRTRARLADAALLDRLAQGVQITAPLGYIEFTALLHNARAVLTDSGGVQKEAYLAGVRCVTLRDRTEWVETVQAGWNTLVDLDAAAATEAVAAAPPEVHPALYGDGHAGARVVAALERWVEGRA